MSFVLKLIEEGEHITQDFKLRVDDSIKIAKTLSAFANTEGGRILIGVRDSGVVAGCNVEEECHMIQAASQMYCKPSVNFEIQVWKVDYKSVLEVTISKSNARPHFVEDNDGAWQAYLRRGDKVNKASPVMVKVWQYEMRLDRSEFRYDHYVCKLFSAWRDGTTLRFVQVSRMANMDFEETESLLALLLFWGIIKTRFSIHGSKRGYVYELRDAGALEKLESEGSEVFRYTKHNVSNFSY
tara:strand:+ start:174 stop:893 length:720 start_codon:yes stop_codon:yes gene_type:complete